VAVETRPADSVPAETLRAYLRATWHGDSVVAHGEVMFPAALPGLVAVADGRLVGHASYRVADNVCELVSLAADPPGRGVGGRLLEAVCSAARAAGCATVRLTTTNDNLDALRLYQRHGFRLRTLRRGAVDEARRTLKPQIPEVGSFGIPMRDELDLERHL
jgi:ribosomal protein S18 acetylase RimI-like enzyme